MIDANVIIACLAAITLLGGLATRTGTPYPVVLVLGGLLMGLIPGVPSPALDPDLVLVLFLPPLLYSSAFLSSADELRRNAVPILQLAVGLVLVTVAAVAVVAHVVAGVPWAVAFVLGAVLGPTDPVSASAILQRLGAPDRIVTILEGESLVNDATAITAYTIAIMAVETGGFSALHAVGTFAFEVVAGTAIGLIAAWAATRVRGVFNDAGVQLSLTLLTPFVAYIPADAIGASGVLAAVAAGLYAASASPESTSASTRMQLRSFWQLLVFLLNALLFLLIGLQLPHVLDGIGGGLSAGLLWRALAIGATVIGLRMVSMFLVPAATSALRRGQGATSAGAGARLVLGWSGMRGAVSLAIALAIPLGTPGGDPFPDRSLVVFFAFAVVLLTLVPAGFTLGPLISRLGLREGDVHAHRLAEGQRRLLHAALEEIEEMAAHGQAGERTAERLRAIYQARLGRLDERLERDGAGEDDLAHQAGLRRAVIAAQRRALGELRDERTYPNDVLREIEAALDAEDVRMR